MKVLETPSGTHYECKPIEPAHWVQLPDVVTRFNRVAALVGWDPHSKPILRLLHKGRDYTTFERHLQMKQTGQRVFVAWDGQLELAVWWTTNQERRVFEGCEIELPEYIDRQLARIDAHDPDSLLGAVLADSEELQDVDGFLSVTSQSPTPFGPRPIYDYLNTHCTGIIVRRSHLPCLVAFPGTITDMWVNQLASREKEST